MLKDILLMRLDNSVPKHNIKAMYGRAAKFVKGTVKEDGNKVTISWVRGERERSVLFEMTHNQKNEKASVFKGYKLKRVLDALEQTYLDGWDKENIIAHLNGRFKLYNLSYDCLKILWTSPQEDDKK
ncbi:MAG: hypothetical protein H0X26_03625 [Alphaproteobacteria bacterium]|nr:hypothetical protein [Alphaproteobacteria bacterium]